MPDILIRGLSLPKEGFTNLSLQSEGYAMLTATSVFDGKTGSYVWQKCDHDVYDAIELPPHGDLIQRSDVLAVVDEAYEYGDVIERKNFDENNIPTIVPAERSCEDG